MTLEELRDYLKRELSITCENDFNQYKIAPNCLKFNKVDVDKYNGIIRAVRSCSDMNRLERTDASIKKGSVCVGNFFSYDIERTKSIIRLTILIGQDAWCVKLGGTSEDKDEDNISGLKAFQEFKRICRKHNIDIYKYAVENGKEIKKDIPSPLIMFKDEYKNMVLTNVHHLDFHSAYLSCLVKRYPEFRPVVKEIYDKRKKKPVCKSILTHTYGMMQSSIVDYKWANLSRDMVDDNINNMLELTKELERRGYEVIGYNTDGIFYKGDKPYYGGNYGKDICQYSNDIINCKFRAKSDGVYEYIDSDGIYHPKARSHYRLDTIKDRKDWQWGDIYKTGCQVKVEFNEENEEVILYESECE